MKVYDLDKTQEWLNRTIQINKTPPVRGGVSTDYRARRQTLSGIAALLLVIGGLALWPHPRPVAPRAAPPAPAVQATAPTTLAQDLIINTTPVQVPQVPQFNFPPESAAGVALVHSSVRNSQAGVNRRSSDAVAPAAPIWLDPK
jgi:hypothetical protein